MACRIAGQFTDVEVDAGPAATGAMHLPAAWLGERPASSVEVAPSAVAIADLPSVGGPTWLPRASGEEVPEKIAACAALGAEARIELDRLEIPTIRAASLEDVAVAQGWLHARERFLQMDLARREAAGELAELVPKAVTMDRETRRLGLRAVAERALAALPAPHRTLLERYAEGVNAQLAAGAPMEYRLLKIAPERWTAVDSVLVQLGMARYLDGSAASDRARAALVRAVPVEVARFLTSASGPLDMSVDGSRLPAPPPLPEAERLDLRAAAAKHRDGGSPDRGHETHLPGRAPAPASSAPHAGASSAGAISSPTSSWRRSPSGAPSSSASSSGASSSGASGSTAALSNPRSPRASSPSTPGHTDGLTVVSCDFPSGPTDYPMYRDTSDTHPGSNAFAVAGSRTADGRAIVCNDMHLAHMAPGIWYRVALEWPDRRLVGLSLPGVPLIVQGTNGLVAWGFTNLTADLADLVIVEPDPADGARYLTEDGSVAYGVVHETLGNGEPFERRFTRYGPVVDTLPDGRTVSLRCATFEPGGIDFGLFELAGAHDLESALSAARRWRGPPQNVLVASADGRVGWTIAGTLPDRRGGMSTPSPVSWREAPAWGGPLESDAKPSILDPASGILTSGNQLAITPRGALASVMGCDEAPGDRAYRLRELLASRSDWTEPALHEVMLDTRSPRLLRWRDAILAALPAEDVVSATPATGDATSKPEAPSPATEAGTDAGQDPAGRAGTSATQGGASPDRAPDRDDARVPKRPPPTLADARSHLAAWDGLVTADATAPVLLDEFRSELRRLFADAVARSAGIAAAASVTAALEDEAVLRALESRAEHLCPSPRGGASDPLRRSDPWRLLVRTTLEAALAGSRAPDNRLATRGERNRAIIRHPAADSLGAAASLAEMPRSPLPGHPTCVRVQTPQFGASQRSAVSPSHLADAILVTPCGQSGLPTSPHFRSLHRSWTDGTPHPLLPGESVSRIALVRELPAAPSPTPSESRPADPAPPPAAPGSRTTGGA